MVMLRHQVQAECPQQKLTDILNKGMQNDPGDQKLQTELPLKLICILMNSFQNKIKNTELREEYGVISGQSVILLHRRLQAYDCN